MRDVAPAVTYAAGEDEFLLLKRTDEKDVYPGVWEFPGGWVEDDETPREAAQRELREETGFTGDVRVVGDPHVVRGDYGEFKVHPVLISVQQQEPDLTWEHVAYRWMPLHEVMALDNTVDGLEQDLRNVGIEVENR